jgi:hypothetical protein
MSALARCLERFGHGRCVRLKRAIGSLTRSAPYRPAQLRKLSSPTKRFEASEKIAISPPWRVGPAWPAFSEGGGWIAKKMHVRSIEFKNINSRCNYTDWLAARPIRLPRWTASRGHSFLSQLTPAMHSNRFRIIPSYHCYCPF